jgi:cytochrome c-type biogenesis protein CcmH
MNENAFVVLSVAAVSLALAFALWPNIRPRLGLKTAETTRLPKGLSRAIIVLLPVVTVGFYLLVGTYGDAEVHDPRVTLLRSQMTEMAEELERNPNQPEKWQRMGLLYKDLQHYGPAEHTLRRALYLRPDSPFLHVELAETLKLRSELSVMPPEARELLMRALALQPDNLKALWLLATDDFLAGNYEIAVAWWEQMLPLVPEDSTMHQAIETETKRAESLMAQQ